MDNIGAHWQKDGSLALKVWAPRVEKMEVLWSGSGKKELMEKDAQGYFFLKSTVPLPGDLYFLLLEGDKKRPDPASYSLPQGVHGPSEVPPSEAFPWKDDSWKGLDLKEAIIYELHVGTFSPQGNFQGVVEKLDYLADLGLNAIELMPVASFPGERNWGYDGVNLFAVQSSYGGPQGLKYLVNEAHKRGLAIGLDLVYNHLGPEGNYLHDLGPYFTDRYHNTWGQALNFDGPQSGPVRDFFITNALRWVKDFHIDFFRLDAVHEIFDHGAKPLLREISRRTKEEGARMGKQVFLVAESDLNDVKIMEPGALGGYELDGQWADEIHHCLHGILTGEKKGYYRDFSPGDLEKASDQFFVYDGNYRPLHQRPYGRPTLGQDAWRFLSHLQNHDQIGNRAQGDRMGTLVEDHQHRLALAWVLLHPGTPYLFMGEEYNETRPFLYFVSHGDQELLKAVSHGRRREFQGFDWQDVPDPAHPQSFDESKLDWEKLKTPRHQDFLAFTQALIKLRKSWPFLRNLKVGDWKTLSFQNNSLFVLEIPKDKGGLVLVGNFCSQENSLPPLSSLLGAQEILYSHKEGWGLGPQKSEEKRLVLDHWSLVVFTQENKKTP